MRLLHAGLPDARGRRAGARAGHRRRRIARRAGVKPLPLYRLSEHHQGGAGCRSRDARIEMMAENFIGRSVARLEDRLLLTGQGRFASDISFPDQLTMRVVRSPSPHAVIRSIDVSEAEALPGVFA